MAPDALAEVLERWCGWAAACLELEAEAVEVPMPHTARTLRGAGPALPRLPEPGGGRLLVVLGARRGLLHLALLLFWLGVAGLLGWRFGARLQPWTGQRLDMTHELVERMVGHRTCLAQEWLQRRDAGRTPPCATTCSPRAASTVRWVPFIGLVSAFVGGAGDVLQGSASSSCYPPFTGRTPIWYR